MARPVAIDGAKILDAAREVFLRHGFRASTALVARKAGVSQGSLFKRYRTKTELFTAAMRCETRDTEWQERLLGSVGRGDVGAELARAGMQLLRRLQVILPRIMMVRSSGVSFAGNYRELGDPPPLAHLRVLEKYFRAEMEGGRLAMAQPRAAAHAFLGALSHYVFCDIVFGFRPASERAYVETVAGMVVRSSAVGAGAGRRRERRRA